MRTRAADLFAVHLQLIRETWAQVKEWRADPAATDGPQDIPESAGGSKSVFEVRIQWPRC